MLGNYIVSMNPRSLVSLIKTFSAASDLELPLFGFIILAIIPGIIDELFAALTIGGAALAIRVIRNEFLNKEKEIQKKLLIAADSNLISQEDYKTSIRYMQQSIIPKP